VCEIAAWRGVGTIVTADIFHVNKNRATGFPVNGLRTVSGL
jgi:hypothetical protein